MNEPLRSSYAEGCGDSQPEALSPVAVDASAGDPSGTPPVFEPPSNGGGTPAVQGERVYLIGNQVLARKSAAGDDIHPWSTGVYCPVCGNVWARVILTEDRSDAAAWPWGFEQSVCVAHVQTHGTRRYIPGSLIPALDRYATGLGRDFKWEDNLPEAVLLREAAVHLRWWEARGDKI